MRSIKAIERLAGGSRGNAFRKRFSCFFSVLCWTAVIIFTFFPVRAAYAANQILVIDSEHVYEGMDKTYAQGYRPRVENGETLICVPLVVSGVYGETVEDGMITVEPDLGKLSESPFEPGDYSRNVSLKRYTVRDENGRPKEADAYYLTLKLPLRSAAVNGRYPVVLNISYLNNSGESIQQSFTVYVENTSGVPPAPAQSEGKTIEEQGLAPAVRVSAYRVHPEIVPAGSSFTVDITLQNTGLAGAVSDILVSYSGAGVDIVPDSGANTFFVSGIEQGAEQTFQIKMRADADAKTSGKIILLTIDYRDAAGSARRAASEIPVQVKQPIRIKYDPPEIPGEVYGGEEISTSIKIYNQGKNTLSNVAVSLSAEGLESRGDAYIGNIEPGGSKTAQVTAESGKNPGVANGKIVIRYEDESGGRFFEEVPFTIRILYGRKGLLGLSVEWRILGWGAAVTIAVVAAYYIRKLLRVDSQRKVKK